MKSFFNKSFQKNKKDLKKEIKFGSLIIRLYNDKRNNINTNTESIGNIQAFDFKGQLAWTVQPSTFNLSYFDIQIDEEKNKLEADSGAGRVYIINLANGSIIHSEIRK